ncbi:ParB family chromosome partitioning protein [Bradyrhizobium diazoefficiens]
MNANTPQLSPNLTHVVPLNLLVQSKANVRKTNTKEGIEGLAANIEAVGLRQNLNVRRLEDGTSEVIAGQRRLLALQLLAQQKKIPEDFLVPCLEVNAEDAHEISLAENSMREAMHPADQFEAFNQLVRGGMPVEDVAARFGVAPSVVKQRMKLSSVAPKLLKLYRAGEMTLEQVMAFTLTDDHKKQVNVWEAAEDRWDREASAIRRALTPNMKEANSRLGRFVGIDAYEAAGGVVVRDLFDERNSGYMSDEALLDKLATEKLEAEAEKLRNDGWSWVKVMPLSETNFWDGTYYDELEPQTPAKFKIEEDEDGDEVEVETNPGVYSAEQMASSGAKVVLNYQGELLIQRGLVERSKVAPSSTSKEKVEKPEWSARQTEELMNQHTSALRSALNDNPHIALAMLAHTMADEIFFHSMEARLVEVSVSSHDTNRQYPYAVVPTPEECSAQKGMTDKQSAWQKKLPKDDEKLLDWCIKQDDETLTSLIVFCTAMSLSTITSKYGYDRTEQTQQLAKVLNFNMADHWQPTAAGFVSRMKKGQMVQALKDVNLPDVAFNVEKMKRDAAVKATATALAGTGWLPAMLRPANDNKKAKKDKAA